MTTSSTRLRRTRVRPTRRGVLLGALGLFLYAAGSNVAAGWVVVLAAACLGALPWAWWSARRAAGHVEVERVLPPRATAGVPTRVGLRVSAPTVAAAVVEDDGNGLVGALRGLTDGADVRDSSALRRGATVDGTVRVELGDPLGLVSAAAEGRVGGACLVVPAVPGVEVGDDALRWAGAMGGRAQRAGDGVEVLGVRDYRSGDPLRAVHWRSTARTGQLVVREFAAEARPTVAVELAPGTWTLPAMDLAADALCGLADGFSRQGHPVEVAVDGSTNPWGDDVRIQLATLPPTPAAPPRPLAAPPPHRADLTVTLAPGQDGVEVGVAGHDRRRDLGSIPLDVPDLGAWLTVRLAGLGDDR